jgi:hypothetical protein
MSDRAYTRFTIPMSVLADESMTEAIRSAFGIPLPEFQAAILADPKPEEAAGHDSFSVRLVDDRPCLVWEDSNCNYGGASIEDALCAGHIPFVQMNDAGDEFGATSTVYNGEQSEVIRLDHDLAPVVGVGLIAGRVVVDPGEIADFEHYQELRNAVLLYPARAA